MASHSESRFPWKHLVGFIFSIVLTLIALWVGLYSGFSTKMIITFIVILAILQAIIQLFMFMHVTESENGKWQTGTMLYAAFIAVAIVAGTIWVMSFGMGYMDHKDMKDMKGHDKMEMKHDDSGNMDNMDMN
ncbi:cytochrome aa3 quinol oxidase subunit IV [Falsibacillus albus]|uniref:Quinol oxidase subunit 4 n=1 Tax=Falsibacillus albus TaxID=2478915 RepID=A0A3L7JRF9_9BACI|nr:cytochrome aa3 quinol oxidase subunit IV [Falsibacillus albus]